MSSRSIGWIGSAVNLAAGATAVASGYQPGWLNVVIGALGLVAVPLIIPAPRDRDVSPKNKLVHSDLRGISFNEKGGTKP